MEQPFDTLKFFKDKVVVVVRKDSSEIVGKLTSYDLNMNITIETAKGVEFVNGFAVDQIILKED